MVSERIQRRVDALLDEAEVAISAGQWHSVTEKARAVLAIDAQNEDAASFLKMSEANGAAAQSATSAPAPPAASSLPASFVSGRYRVLRFLGEGGRKRVFLARDERLGREVAFGVIKTEGLDAMGRERVEREAQAMARLGSHPNLVAIHDIGDDRGDIYMVQEYMAGGDVAALLRSGDGGLALERALALARGACHGLGFIHRAGLIHRDLKPANIFVGDDGAARVGDFGLAMAMDLSRITQHGTFIGTVAYMAPEQAVGGDVSPRSDLYALGCVLYEMVTGRPPFIGDGPTAVISQHLNTSPVAPSWHRADCPPSLERVILALLEKDPAQRPETAAAAEALLAGVDLSEQPAVHPTGHALERIARGVFVGREKELASVRTAFDDSLSGRGSVVMLVGEPGIGKTRATQEIETFARMRGARVLWGRAHEASGAPSYWPWKQIGNAHAQFVPPAELAGSIEPSQVAELRRLFPALQGPEVPPNEDGGSAQFRLYDAFTAFIRAGSELAPLVLVLDDLHWADKPSLTLLEYLARELSHMRVLVIGTYRDTDLVRTHPLSVALASLNRDAGFIRLPLRGLSREEVETYIKATSDTKPSSRTLTRIYEETEGNPFFLAEVVNLMAQEGTLSRDSVSDIAIPEGVKEALGRRLDRLSGATNELLQTSAVVGREFTFDTLRLVGDRSDDALLTSIEEAVEARVIEEMDRPGRYRFTHALMQETLLGELTTTRRVRIHGLVGDALEKRWGTAAGERPTRLAEHFVEAAMLSTDYAERAVKYAMLAAKAAEAETGWAEAARWYERCLAIMADLPGGIAGDEAELLLGLGSALVYDAVFPAAWLNLNRAMTLYRDRGDRMQAAECATLLLLIPGSVELHQATVAEGLRLVGEQSPEYTAKFLAASAPPGAMSPETFAEVSRLADAHGLDSVRPRLVYETADQAFAELDFERAAALFDEAERLGRSSYQTESIGYPLMMRAMVAFMPGDVAHGREVGHASLASINRIHAEFPAHNVELRLAGVALLRHELAEFERIASLADRLTGSFGLQLLRVDRAEVAGDLQEAARLLPDPRVAGWWPPWAAQIHAARARIGYQSGDLDAARDEITAFEDQLVYVTWTHRYFFNWFYALTELGDAVAAIANDDVAEQLYGLLRGCEPIRWDPECARGADAIRGALALRLGLIEDAEDHYRTGLDWATAQKLPVEEGRNVEGLAAVAEARGDTAAAIDYLDTAAERFRSIDAAFYLSRVVGRRVNLLGLADTDPQSSILAVSSLVEQEKPSLRQQAAPDGTVTLLFSDIENSTPLNERLGDAKWIDLLREHNALIDREVRLHNGYVVKTIGDGYMVAFRSAADGLRCAIAIQSATPELREGLRVRIGLHTGEMTREGDDFFGRHVNLAARVAGSAVGGEVLVSGVVHEVVSGQGFEFEDGGERTMKGFDEPVRVWSVRWLTA